MSTQCKAKRTSVDMQGFWQVAASFVIEQKQQKVSMSIADRAESVNAEQRNACKQRCDQAASSSCELLSRAADCLQYSPLGGDLTIDAAVLVALVQAVVLKDVQEASHLAENQAS